VTATHTMSVTIYQDTDGWRWRAQAGNNEIIASGEAYKQRGDAEHICDLIFGETPVVITVKDKYGRTQETRRLR